MKSLEEQLNDVKEAIEAVLSGGQSYKIGSRQMTRADLSQLRKMKLDIEKKMSNSGNDSLLGGAYVACFDRR